MGKEVMEGGRRECNGVLTHSSSSGIDTSHLGQGIYVATVPGGCGRDKVDINSIGVGKHHEVMGKYNTSKAS